MPIKNKIELLTPGEREELERIQAKLGKESQEELHRWVELREIAHKEFRLNQTPEERKAWEEMNIHFNRKMKMFDDAF